MQMGKEEINQWNIEREIKQNQWKIPAKDHLESTNQMKIVEAEITIIEAGTLNLTSFFFRLQFTWFSITDLILTWY